MLICPIATWDAITEELTYLNAPAPTLQAYQHIHWIIQDNNHWFHAECYKSNGQALFYLTSPPQTAGRLLPLIQHLRTALGFNGGQLIHSPLPIPSSHSGHVWAPGHCRAL